MAKPHLISEIADALCISEKELYSIKKYKNIEDIILEDIIRDIDTILNYLDLKDKFISNSIRKIIADEIITSSISSIPKKEFYRKKLSKIDFSREKVLNDLNEKEIDYTYRLEKLASIIPLIDKKVDSLLEKEKDYLLNYNHQKLYKQLSNEKNKKNLVKKI